MAKQDLYHKVTMEEVLKELEITQAQKPWTHEREDADRHSDKVKLNPGASLEELSAFESKAGQNLPDDYKAFLQKSNGAHIFGIELYSLKDLEHKPFIYMHGEQDRHAMEVYAIAHWYTGDDVLLNLKVPTGAKDKTRRDVIDRFHETDECRVIAKSFGEFLYRMIKGSKIHDEKVDNPEYWKNKVSDVPSQEELETYNKAIYWLNDGFRPHREINGVEFDEE